jgi:hypothetical protein
LRAILIPVLTILVVPAAASAAPTQCDTLWMQRNAIFRDAGYCFHTSKGVQLFGNEGCRYDNEHDLPLSDRQREAIRRIAAAEARNLCNAPSAWQESFSPIRFRIELTAAALRKLVDNGETIRIAAMYFGNTRREKANDADGDVPLGDDYFDFRPEEANSISIPVRPFSRKALDPIFDRTPRVNINVFSSRNVFKYNVIDCSGPQDSVVELSKEVQVVRCKLIGEPG